MGIYRVAGTIDPEVKDVRFSYQLIDESPPTSGMGTHWGRAARVEDIASYVPQAREITRLRF